MDSDIGPGMLIPAGGYPLRANIQKHHAAEYGVRILKTEQLSAVEYHSDIPCSLENISILILDWEHGLGNILNTSDTNALTVPTSSLPGQGDLFDLMM